MMYVHSCTEIEVKNPDEAFNVIYAGKLLLLLFQAELKSYIFKIQLKYIIKV